MPTPPAARPVELLFVGWNPPRTFAGFWSSDAPDNLRTEVHALLRRTGHAITPEPDDAFLDEFRVPRRFFFVHAVKCWTKPKYPGFHRKARRKDRRDVGAPLLNICATAHLGGELADLTPRRVVALGELAYEGLYHVFPDLRSDARPTDGRVLASAATHPWPLLYTCFLSAAPVDAQALRDYTRRHLEPFLQRALSATPKGAGGPWTRSWKRSCCPGSSRSRLVDEVVATIARLPRE